MKIFISDFFLKKTFNLAVFLKSERGIAGLGGNANDGLFALRQVLFQLVFVVLDSVVQGFVHKVGRLYTGVLPLRLPPKEPVVVVWVMHEAWKPYAYGFSEVDRVRIKEGGGMWERYGFSFQAPWNEGVRASVLELEPESHADRNADFVYAVRGGEPDRAFPAPAPPVCLSVFYGSVAYLFAEFCWDWMAHKAPF